MKYLLLVILALLVVASLVIRASFPESHSEVPVIYWVTDSNSARQEQVQLFQRWLVDNGHTTTDGKPKVTLKLDTNNGTMEKVLIQGVSGIGGDLLDIRPGSMRYLQDVGLLADITEPAREMGFAPSHTYAAMRPEITVDDRQYTFPANVFVRMMWVNKAAFEDLGLELPPRRWTLDEFERRGEVFVEAANAGLERQTHFFANDVDLLTMHRSLGLSVFNETLTQCTLDDPRFAHVLELKRRWRYELGLLPTAAEESSFQTASGTGGAAMQLFARGQYAMFVSGRYALVKLRHLGELSLDVVEPPNGGYPNALTGTRSTAIYVGGKHQNLAELFLSYLASEPYNMQIVRDGDALPPVPQYTQIEAFLRPPGHRNEWGTHAVFAEAVETIAIGGVYSPFVLDSVVQRHIDYAEEAVMANRLSPEAAARQAAQRINAEIHRNANETAESRQRYRKLLEVQAKIDELRERGEPIPLELIQNPFYQHYYQDEGWTR